MGLPMTKLSLPDFLAWEDLQDGRHEFYRGEVFAMVGARRVHGIVSLNIAAALKQQLRGTRCRAFAETMKIQIDDHTIVYPDVFVTCDAADLRTERVFKAPTVVVEVLSPSTEGNDRGLKFALYRSLPGLREYLLVDPDTRETTLFRRNDEGLFVLHDLTGRVSVTLASIGCELAADDVFEGVDPPPGWQSSLPV